MPFYLIDGGQSPILRTKWSGSQNDVFIPLTVMVVTISITNEILGDSSVSILNIFLYNVLKKGKRTVRVWKDTLEWGSVC